MITTTNFVAVCPRCRNTELFLPVAGNLVRCGSCKWMLRRDASGKLTSWLDVGGAGKKRSKPRK